MTGEGEVKTLDLSSIEKKYDKLYLSSPSNYGGWNTVELSIMKGDIANVILEEGAIGVLDTNSVVSIKFGEGVSLNDWYSLPAGVVFEQIEPLIEKHSP